MRRAALVEETAEQDQRSQLQERRLPVARQLLQVAAAEQAVSVIDGSLAVRGQLLVVKVPALQAVTDQTDREQREHGERKRVVLEPAKDRVHEDLPCNLARRALPPAACPTPQA